jgi:hypothetical protein
MRLTDTVTLAPLPGELPTARIMVRGADTGARVDGVVLEAAVEAEGRTLLFVTDDVPFEEGLHIQLFDAQWQRLDRADLGWIYATGSFRDLTLLDAKRLRFAFFDEPLVLELFDRPVRQWFQRSHKGVGRPLGAPRHFGLSRAP